MFNFDQNINQVPNIPGLPDLLNYFEKNIKLNFNCHHIGTIQTFNPATQTATASVNYTQTFIKNSVTGKAIETVAYPILVDCPVICLGGGTGYLTFPIASGDECLILFNDRDIDNWYSGSSNSSPATGRLHAYSDAIILVGLRSLSKVIVGYDSTAINIQNGANNLKVFTDKIVATVGSNTIDLESSKAVVTVAGNTLTLDSSKAVVSLGTTSLELDSTGKVKVTNPTGELLASLNQLFTDIQNATVTTMLGPQPLIMPTYVADLAIFQSFKA